MNSVVDPSTFNYRQLPEHWKTPLLVSNSLSFTNKKQSLPQPENPSRPPSGEFQWPKSAVTIASITIDRSNKRANRLGATGADDSVSRSFAGRDLIEKSICTVADSRAALTPMRTRWNVNQPAGVFRPLASRLYRPVIKVRWSTLRHRRHWSIGGLSSRDNYSPPTISADRVPWTVAIRILGIVCNWESSSVGRVILIVSRSWVNLRRFSLGLFFDWVSRFIWNYGV